MPAILIKFPPAFILHAGPGTTAAYMSPRQRCFPPPADQVRSSRLRGDKSDGSAEQEYGSEAKQPKTMAKEDAAAPAVVCPCPGQLLDRLELDCSCL